MRIEQTSDFMRYSPEISRNGSEIEKSCQGFPRQEGKRVGKRSRSCSARGQQERLVGQITSDGSLATSVTVRRTSHFDTGTLAIGNGRMPAGMLVVESCLPKLNCLARSNAYMSSSWM